MPLSLSIAANSTPADFRRVYRLAKALMSTKQGLLAVTFLFALSSTPLFAARNPDPAQRLPLTPFGFQTIPERYLLQGATMVTVDFVDNTHLLVSFGLSKLMARLPDCPADDEDRTVKAVLLELPSGRELAATEWRFHDHGQYLWNLGGGRFLLRNRDTLTTFDALHSSAKAPDGPFAQTPFLHFSRRIEAIVVSADRDLLAIETTKPKAHIAVDPMLQVSTQPSPASNSTPTPAVASPAHASGLQRRDPGAAAADPQPVEISFLRLLRGDPATVHSHSSESASDAPGRILAQLLARIRTDKVVNFPLTTEGFLEIRAESRNGVLFHFITYTGRDLDLGDFPTSCHPRPTFISHSEFVTYGCRGADESLDLAGFNLRGDMIWQINFTDNQAYPSFASAPASGRFAFSRTIITTNVFGSETPSASQLSAQEIRVVQMYNGKQLVRAVASPIQRAGQNYALAPDGLTLAVIHDAPGPPVERGEKPLHDTAVELFKLPALSPKDLDEIKKEAAMAPPPADVPMRFSMQEIKDALHPVSDADAKIAGDSIRTDASPSQSPMTRFPDAHIVGDPVPPATAGQQARENSDSSQSPRIPTADPTPACANLTEKSVAACPVTSKPVTSKPGIEAQAKSAPTSDSEAQEPEKRRKPPTLYEPAPASAPQ